MNKLFFIPLLACLSCVMAMADEVVVSDTSTMVTDTLPAELDSVPEWYVAPIIPDSLLAPLSVRYDEANMAPGRAATAAASCMTDSILTFDIDSVLVEGTCYDYDASGRVICSTVWTYNPDGSRVGKSKMEYGFTGSTQTMTATYEWDNTINDWKGTTKYEYVYKGGKMTSSTTLVWLNISAKWQWVPDKRYTYAYDAEGRETEYYEYNRNTATNQLQPAKGRVQTWIDETRKSLYIEYTAYSNGNWSAGTKKEWAYDADDNQTLYAYYSTITNGKWIGSSKEEWEYTDGVLTMNAKYGWVNDDWSGTLKEVWGYTDGVKTLYEKYTGYSNGKWIGNSKETWKYTSGILSVHTVYVWGTDDWIGSFKEQWTYTSGNLTLYLKEVWSNGDWVGSFKEKWTINTSGKQTLHEQYDWGTTDWTMTLRETNTYDGNNLILVENYKWVDGVKIGTKKEETTYESGKKTMFIAYTWVGDDWVGTNKDEWTFTSGKETKHEAFEWSDGWNITLQENTTYDGSTIVKIENYALVSGVWSGTKKEEYAYSSGKKTQEIVYAWTDGLWVESTKEVWGYTSDQQTLHEQYNWAGGWVGISKETWTYTSGKETKHELYGWAGDWVMVQQENTTYDGANIIRIENYALVSGVWSGTQKEEYAYTSGKKTQTITYIWTDGDWIKATKAEEGYQDGNTTVSATNYTWNGTTWIGSGTRTLTTYEGDKVKQLLTQNWPEGASDWTDATRSQHTYNADGEDILTHNASWDGTKWVMTSMSRLDIIIDSEDRQLLRATWTCNADSVWKGTRKDTAAYSATGKTLFVGQYTSWKKSAWVPSYKIEYEYDEADQLTLEQRMNWVSSKWQGQYKYEYEYDAEGRQIVYASYSSWNTSTNNWVGSSKREYVYNANGQYESRITYRWKSNKWTPSFLYTYVYDASNREIEQLVQSYANGVWINANKYTKEYSGSKLVKNNEYLWLNEQWVFSSRDEQYYDTDAQAKLRREIIASWNSGVVTSFNDNHYFYSCDPHIYTIRFVNYDGTLLYSEKLNEGQTPNYTGQTPTRTEDAQYTYTFAGWDKEITAADAHATYTATYSTTSKSYSITWLNEDGSLIDQTTVEYGVKPTHAAPTKVNTSEFTYTFTGWTPEITEVTGEATYKATFSQTTKKYKVTFEHEDGSVIEAKEWNYGVIPDAPTTPFKPATAQYTYTFAGWTPEVIAVTGEATYKATFTETKNKYLITFKNGDEVLQSSEVEYGVKPAYTGETPAKEATAQYTYTFAGWDAELVAVAGEATYKATFTQTVNKYTITFKNGDEVLQSTEVEYGVKPAYTEEIPTKEATAQYAYTFAGWDAEIVAVTGEATYTATFSQTVNEYTITFVNYNDEVLQNSKWAYGATPVFSGAKPAKPADGQYTYIFAGWTPEIAAVTGNATYKATYTEKLDKYLITFEHEDGSVIEAKEWDYGVIPDAPTTPFKPATAQYTYTFAGWSPEIVAVTGEATYKAMFSSTVNEYTVTFKNGENVLQSAKVAYGTVPAYNGETPAKEATAQYTYAFAGWTPEITEVIGEATYKATFSQTVNKYKVTFAHEDGTTIEEKEWDYGATPVAPAAPTKGATAQYSYTFAGWNNEITEVTEEASYKATFTQTVNKYTVTFAHEDGTTIEAKEWEYGATPVAPAAPTKAANAVYTYTFAGWDKEITDVTGETTYKAVFTKLEYGYTVTFMCEGRIIQSSQVKTGSVPEYKGETPAKTGTAAYYYRFTGWDKKPVAVTENAVYTAEFEKVMNEYTIVWVNDDDTELDRATYEYGQMPATEVLPSKPDDAKYTYTFAGWNKTMVAATADATYKATYSKTAKVPTDLDNVQSDNDQCTKIMIDGRIYILRGGKTYTLDGTLVK